MIGYIRQARIISLLIFSLCHVTIYAGLVDSSPFIPPDFKVQASGGESTLVSTSLMENQIEFRGLYQFEGEYWFLLAGKGNANGSWLKIGEKNDLVRILNFDEDKIRLEIEHNSTTGWVNLKALPELSGIQSTPQNNAIPARSQTSIVSSRPATRGITPVSVSRRITRPGTLSSNLQENPDAISIPRMPSSGYRSRETLAAPEKPPQLSSSSFRGNVPNIDISTKPPPSGRPEGRPPSERPPRGP